MNKPYVIIHTHGFDTQLNILKTYELLHAELRNRRKYSKDITRAYKVK